VLPDTAEYVCNLFGYEKFLAQNGGVEAPEGACKIARRWGYVVKNVPDDQADILGMNDAFWGRSIAASGSCGVPERGYKFGPHTPGFSLVDFDDAPAIEKHLKNTPNCVAVMLEPL
jgi:ornithine--oxo-acid transaminase